MPNIIMVRHGRAAAGFGSHPDPGLDEVGRAQAQTAADRLAGAAPAPIYSSPLLRARQTAQPLAERWQAEVRIEDRVAEIPSPTEDLRERAEWLRGVMAGAWRELPEPLQRWRQEMVDCVLGFETDVVVFCHFIAINVIVGAATGAEPLIVFRPDNASITRLSTQDGRLALLELGAEGASRVN